MTQKHGIKYVVFYSPDSGLDVAECLTACRSHCGGRIMSVRNTRRDVLEQCDVHDAIAITAVRRGSRLARDRRRWFCTAVVVE